VGLGWVRGPSVVDGEVVAGSGDDATGLVVVGRQGFVHGAGDHGLGCR
jgi:hypothetical protein